MGKRLNPYSVKSRHWLALTFAAALCMALRLKGRVRFFPGNRIALPRGD